MQRAGWRTLGLGGRVFGSGKNRKGKIAAGFSALAAFALMVNIPVVSGETYTLPDVYLLALDEYEQVQITRQEVRIAEKEITRALAGILPKITINGNYERSPKELGASGMSGSSFILQSENSFRVEATLKQPLYRGGQSRAAFHIAKYGLEVAHHRLDLSSEALLSRVVNAFYGVLKAKENLGAQRRNVERLQEHRRLSGLRYEVGEVTESVFLRAQAELAGAEAELTAVESELLTDRRELQVLADLSDGFDLDVPPEPAMPEAPASALINMALEHRDDLQQHRLQEQITREQVAFARGEFLPSLSLEGSYFRRDEDPKSSFFIEDSWLVGVRLELPIFDGGLRLAELAQAQARQEQNRLETARLAKEIDLDIIRTSLALESVNKAFQFRQQQLEFATKNYELVSRQLTFGLATNIDLLDANQIMVEAERDVIAATYDRHLAILDLQRSVGVLLTMVLGESDPNP